MRPTARIDDLEKHIDTAGVSAAELGRLAEVKPRLVKRMRDGHGWVGRDTAERVANVLRQKGAEPAITRR